MTKRRDKRPMNVQMTDDELLVALQTEPDSDRYHQDEFIMCVALEKPPDPRRPGEYKTGYVRGRKIWVSAVIVLRIAGCTEIPMDQLWHEIVKPYDQYERSFTMRIFPFVSCCHRFFIYRQDLAALEVGESEVRKRIENTEDKELLVVFYSE